MTFQCTLPLPSSLPLLFLVLLLTCHRFGSAMLRGVLLKPETLRLLFTPQTTTSGTKTKYGLGWSVDVHQPQIAGMQRRRGEEGEEEGERERERGRERGGEGDGERGEEGVLVITILSFFSIFFLLFIVEEGALQLPKGSVISHSGGAVGASSISSLSLASPLSPFPLRLSLLFFDDSSQMLLMLPCSEVVVAVVMNVQDVEGLRASTLTIAKAFERSSTL